MTVFKPRPSFLVEEKKDHYFAISFLSIVGKLDIENSFGKEFSLCVILKWINALTCILKFVCACK